MNSHAVNVLQHYHTTRRGDTEGMLVASAPIFAHAK